MTVASAKRLTREHRVLVAGLLLAISSVAHGGVSIVAGPRYDPQAPHSGVGSNTPKTPYRPMNNSGSILNGFTAVLYNDPMSPRPVVAASWSRAYRADHLSSAAIELARLDGLPDGQDNQTIYSLNDLSIAVGSAERHTPQGASLGMRAVRWNPDGSVVELDHLGTDAQGATSARATQINAAGTMVGDATLYVNGVSVGQRPVRWNGGSTTATMLGGIGDAYKDGATVSAINRAGIAVGSASLTENGVYKGGRALRWDVGSIEPVVLGTYPDADSGPTYVNDISDTGFVTGEISKRVGTNTFGPRAVRWDAAGNLTELGTLGIRSDGFNYGGGYAVNDAGTVAGFTTHYDNGIDRGFRPTIWKAGSTEATELGNFGTNASGYTSGFAYDVNNRGAVVGRIGYRNGDFAQRAVLWLPGSTTPIDLTDHLADPRWTRLVEASSISETGFIGGYGDGDIDGDGPEPYDRRSFTMLVPEAGTYGLGDANFDVKIDFADLLILAQHYGDPNPTKNVTVADLNLDGVTDFTDLLAIAQNYGTGDAAFQADWSFAQSLVPEPGSVALLVMALPLARRRRSRVEGRGRASLPASRGQ